VIDLPTEVEPRVTAGDAELWLSAIQFEKLPQKDRSIPAKHAAPETGGEYGLSPPPQTR
jgi:hypothetical protein